MSARDEIIAKVSDRLPVATELPDLDLDWIQYPDPAAQFTTVLASVGGQCLRASDAASAQRQLESITPFALARQTYSAVPGVGRTSIDLSTISNPHQLADVDFAVLPGELAVAENAAIWVATDDVLLRTLYFVTQHLAIVVPASAVVDNMHAAYRRINVSRTRFGTLLSGPSKTADIEQSLVIGAHGARSLTVFLLG